MPRIIIAPKNKARVIPMPYDTPEYAKGAPMKEVLAELPLRSGGVYVRMGDGWLYPAEFAEPPALTEEQHEILTAIREWTCTEFRSEFESIEDDPEWNLSEVGVLYTTHEYEEDGWNTHDLQVYADVSDPEHPCLRVLFDWKEVYREEHTPQSMLKDIEFWDWDSIYSWALHCVPDELKGR